MKGEPQSANEELKKRRWKDRGGRPNAGVMPSEQHSEFSAICDSSFIYVRERTEMYNAIIKNKFPNPPERVWSAKGAHRDINAQLDQNPVASGSSGPAGNRIRIVCHA